MTMQPFQYAARRSKSLVTRNRKELPGPDGSKTTASTEDQTMSDADNDAINRLFDESSSNQLGRKISETNERVDKIEDKLATVEKQTKGILQRVGQTLTRIDDVETAVADLDAETLPEDMPRASVTPGTVKYRAMLIIRDEAPVTTDDLSDVTAKEARPTSTLSDLYVQGLVNRDESTPDDEPYIYTGLSCWGEQALEDIDDDGSQTTFAQELQPWDRVDLPKGQVVGLRIIAEYDGHPTSGDLIDDYESYGYTVNDDGTSVAAVLSKLYNGDRDYHDGGFVDRTPWEPYKYTVSELGEELLRDANWHPSDD